MARHETHSDTELQPPSRRLLPTLAIVVLLSIIVWSAVYGVPATLWTQPGFAEVRLDILEAFGLPTPGPTPTAGAVAPSWYQVYFTSPRYPDVESERQGGIDSHLVALIDRARSTVDVAAYELDLETVATALLQARERGVTVRLVTDTDNLSEPAVERLRPAGIPVVADERSAIMHNKFVVVDGRWVWTGSWNLTVNCTYRNNNNAIAIDSPALARNYSAEFAEMFEQQSFGPRSPTSAAPARVTVEGTAIESYFAPEDRVADRILAVVGQARESVRFLAFSFTDERLGQALIERAEAGVSVAGVVEKRGSETTYAQLGPLRQAGLDVLPDGNPYVMHHKVLIIDREVVVTGSFNFSGSADRSNDENILIIRNRDLASEYLAEFERIRQQALQAQQPG